MAHPIINGGKIKQNYPLKKLATMAVGGPARYFIIIRREGSLRKAVSWVRKNNQRWYIVGEGSNLIPSDGGFTGLIIKNELAGFRKDGASVVVGAGANLSGFIRKLNRLGLAGLEKMAGIPGTVGGAIYGSAGAYGQEIKDQLRRIKIFDGKSSRWLLRKKCEFNYRESVFKKKKNWVIVAAEFWFRKDNPKKLQKTSKEIIKIREQKYRPGLACPGSFFKNIVLAKIKPIIRKRLAALVGKAKLKLWHGKLPAAWLLEQVGAKGMASGKIRVADHHANLIYNSGGGKSADIEKIAKTLKNKVKRKFGVILEEEIQYL